MVPVEFHLEGRTRVGVELRPGSLYIIPRVRLEAFFPFFSSSSFHFYRHPPPATVGWYVLCPVIAFIAKLPALKLYFCTGRSKISTRSAVFVASRFRNEPFGERGNELSTKSNLPWTVHVNANNGIGRFLWNFIKLREKNHISRTLHVFRAIII